ncbi:unnamed protein product [Jaminaea pallidilutea]
MSSEREPLLQRRPDGQQSQRQEGQRDSSDHDEQQAKPTPLPKLQIFILCLIRLAEPTAIFIIFPTINWQLQEALPHVEPSRIGYYSGLIESAFSLVQFIVSPLWGRLSDRIGRKPVLIASLMGLAISMNAFGLARSFLAITLARCVNGLFGGSIGSVKTILGESTDKTNNARAFSLLPIMFSVGSIVGPFLGGQLSHPADKFGFLNFDFLQRHPYWFPCGVVSVYILFAAVIAGLFLEETLSTKRRKQEADSLRQDANQQRSEQQQQQQNGSSSRTEGGENGERQRLLSAEDEEEEANRLEQRAEEEDTKFASPSIRSLLTAERVKILTTQALINFLNICWVSLIPLFCFEQVKDGGVGLTQEGVGHLLASNGALSILVQVLLFPWAEQRLGGPLPVYKISLVFFIPAFSSLPVARLLMIHSGVQASWASLIAGTAFKATTGMAVVCATLLVNNCAPKGSLGTLNGVSQSFGSLARAIGPTASTSLFAFCSTHDGFGWVIWAVLIVTGVITCLLSQRIHVNRPEE